MTWYNDEAILDEVIRRYVAGEGPSQIAKSFDLTRNQILSKMVRLGLARPKPTDPGRQRRETMASAIAARRAANLCRPARATRKTDDPHIVRVERALANGPKSVAEISEFTSLSSSAASRACQILARRGVIERWDKGETGPRYRLRPRAALNLAAAPTQTKTRSSISAEEGYISLRRGGMARNDAAARLHISASSVPNFERSFRLDVGTTQGQTDSSTPKFANHDLHLRAVGRGYPALSERRGPNGFVAPCLPLLWPEARP